MDAQSPPGWPRKSRLQALWPLAIAALIIVASSRTRVAAPSVVNIDKLAHFGVYGLLATLLCRLGIGWRAAAWAWLAASAFGATDEWHQSFVPGREVQLADWLADSLGAALAVALYAGWTRYRLVLETPVWRRRQPGADRAPAPAGEFPRP